MVDVLDDPRRIRQKDAQGMLDILSRLDQQLEEALEIGLGADVHLVDIPVASIILCGMGGSAIGGDILRAYLGGDFRIPFLVNRNYSVPGFAGPSSLALMSSYSGNTEETVSAFHAAREAGCRVIVITTGGQLGALAEKHSCPCLLLPGGLPPRTAWAYSATSCLVILSRLGLIADPAPEVNRAAEWVRERTSEYALENPLASNPAKQLAAAIRGRIPVVCGSQDRLQVVAVRWCGQFSENAKQLAYASALPEMNHNEIMGWKHPRAILGKLTPIFLRDRDDHPRVGLRTEITRKLVGEVAAPLEYWTQGKGWLERLLSLIMLGDYASVYLAFLNEEDPTPVSAIEDLKIQLRDQEKA